MKLTVNINGEDTEIVLTSAQIAKVKKAGTNVIDRIKTFEDALADQIMTVETFTEMCEFDTPDEIAYKKLKIIVKALVGDWVPDFTNSNQYKYSPYFKYTSGFGFSYSRYGNWFTGTHVGSRLVFPTSELAMYAGKQFEDIYKEYLG